MYRLSDYDYPLPKELIAQEPLSAREKARLLVLNRRTGEIIHTEFFQIINYLIPNDVLVINDTRVIPARLIGKKETGGRVEILLLSTDPNKIRDKVLTAEALLRASRAPKVG
ncbi:MAG TPA: tRNA preQ1(34) S-adenosylmethionine ribosyltransferase-isomerase QueA, partial [Candidatus Desulfofervidus auxilii]|nr:tRNA preQ1(34) S-adenosylmethionine ribosyltransferase-isomerase QueA [Candidatus Desulfofervidus auxilii]